MATTASHSAPEHPAGITPDLSSPEFEAFRALIVARTGIALGPHKRALLQARLGTRLRALGLPSGTTGASSSSTIPRATSSPASSTR